MTMTHSVIARDVNDKIVQIITCFNEKQIPIAKSSIEKDYPGCVFSIKSSPEDTDREAVSRH